MRVREEGTTSFGGQKIVKGRSTSFDVQETMRGLDE